MEDTTSTSFRISYSYDPAFSSDLLDHLITDPDRVIETEAHIIKHDRTTTVARIERNNFCWIIKRYNTKNLWHALRRMVRNSRAQNCWKMSKHFDQTGISIPRPVAYIEKRFGPFRGKSYFINEYVEAENIFTYITTHPDPVVTKTTEQKVVELFEALRTTGINHGDMKATNLLVYNENLLVLDLDAAKMAKSGALFELGYKKDRFRFLKNWQNYPDLYKRFDTALPV